MTKAYLLKKFHTIVDTIEKRGVYMGYSDSGMGLEKNESGTLKSSTRELAREKNFQRSYCTDRTGSDVE